jgi:putative membrane protein insertion efficiency factor
MKRLIIFIIRLYQMLISPLFGRCCRFEPSCSAYAIESVHKHGPWRGTWLAIRRVARCHPFSKSGYDPVP